MKGRYRFAVPVWPGGVRADLVGTHGPRVARLTPGDDISSKVLAS
jgi:hypothetical protein